MWPLGLLGTLEDGILTPIETRVTVRGLMSVGSRTVLPVHKKIKRAEKALYIYE